jgi:hypothetical protein
MPRGLIDPSPRRESAVISRSISPGIRAFAAWRAHARRRSPADRLDHRATLDSATAARRRTVVVLGHEATGIPAEALDLLDGAVEIPRGRQFGRASTSPSPAPWCCTSSAGCYEPRPEAWVGGSMRGSGRMPGCSLVRTRSSRSWWVRRPVCWGARDDDFRRSAPCRSGGSLNRAVGAARWRVHSTGVKGVERSSTDAPCRTLTCQNDVLAGQRQCSGILTRRLSLNGRQLRSTASKCRSTALWRVTTFPSRRLSASSLRKPGRLGMIEIAGAPTSYVMEAGWRSLDVVRSGP